MKRFPFPLPADVPLYLAPMQPVSSESPFRPDSATASALALTWSSPNSSLPREFAARTKRPSASFGLEPDERPIGVQIFGGDPVAMGEAAALVTDVFAPEFIDINFGCPVKKVVKRNGGSGCLKDLNLVQEVIRAVARSTSLPVTCKIRSGWNEEMRDPVTIALRCQDAGVRALALHARTRTQMYSGHAHWDEIAAVAAAVDIPVLGNGDIKTPHDAFRMWKQTGCAGIMIAGGSFGQPWIFDQTRDLLEGLPMRAVESVDDRFGVALDGHASHGERLRARPPRCRNRIPKAPRLVCEGVARVCRTAKEAARGHVAHRSRRHLRGVSSHTRPDTGSSRPAVDAEPLEIASEV